MVVISFSHPPSPNFLVFQLHFTGSALTTRGDRSANFLSERSCLAAPPQARNIAIGALVVATFSSDRQRRRVSPAAGESDMCPGSEVDRRD